MTPRLPLSSLVLLLGIPGFAACTPSANIHCQSGPKYGTECYVFPDPTEPTGEPALPVRSEAGGEVSYHFEQ